MCMCSLVELNAKFVPRMAKIYVRTTKPYGMINENGIPFSVSREHSIKLSLSSAWNALRLNAKRMNCVGYLSFIWNENCFFFAFVSASSDTSGTQIVLFGFQICNAWKFKSKSNTLSFSWLIFESLECASIYTTIIVFEHLTVFDTETEQLKPQTNVTH